MQFEFSVNSLDKISADAILVFAYQGEKEIKPLSYLKNLDKKL